MGNASKALLIAASVLIVIILISFGMIMLNSTQDTVEDAQGVGSSISDASQSAVGKLETAFNKGGKTRWIDNKDGSYTKEGITKKVGETFTNDEVLTFTGGTKKKYTGTWTVLGVENGRLKLVSTSNVKNNVTLGLSDPKAPAGTDIEKAIWSYNNVVNTLNSYAQEATGIKSARSITIEDIEKVLNITKEEKLGLTYDEYGKIYNYFYDTTKSRVLVKNKISENAEWSSEINTGLTSQIFVDKNGQTVIVDSENDQVVLENTYYYKPNAFTGTSFANSLGEGAYWLASGYIGCGTIGAALGIRYVSGDSINCSDLVLSTIYAYYDFYGVRAVVYI